MSAPPHASSLEEVLVARPVPKSLSGVLDEAWTLLAEQGCILLNRPSEGYPTCYSANTGEGLLTYLTGIVSCGSKYNKGISFLGIEESGQVTHAHSLFCVSAGDYV